MKNPSSQEIFQLIDLTTLNATDFSENVKALADFAIEQSRQGFFVAALCVHSNFAGLLANELKNSGINSAVVAGAFPHGQATIDVKMLEVKNACDAGVNEIDIVINRGLLLSGAKDEMATELRKMRQAAGATILKTIIESGELETSENIRLASEISLDCGADFIKTSTGKSAVGATKEAVEVMCEVIRDHYNKTGERRGIKVSGGVKTYEDAVQYYRIVDEILGESWLNKNLFRLGASSLAKELLSQYK